jgi:triosephosphate isomerase
MTLKTPIIVVNFKTYKESSGENALKLAKICEEVAISENVNIAICVNTIDLKEVVGKVSIPVLAQHIDDADFGGFTGKILPQFLTAINVKGSLINHSEDRYTLEQMQKVVTKCKTNNLFSLVCSQDVAQSVEIAKMQPDAVAVEPPELIGGDISVTTANPKVVSDTVAAVRQHSNCIVLCGAGVKNQADVRKAIELGSGGVLLASGITKAKDPKAVLLDLAAGLK